MTLNTAGNKTVTAADSTDIGKTANTSPSTTVNVGAFTNHGEVLVPGVKQRAPLFCDRQDRHAKFGGKTGGTAFYVIVNAVDANWNKIISVVDNVGITSSDGSATLPGSAALVSGTKTFSVTLKTTAGGQTVTATDSSAGTTGTSATITVAAPLKYRTLTGLTTGNWNDFNTWEVSSDGNSAGLPQLRGQVTPVSSHSRNTIEIRSGANVTVTASVSVDQVTVDSGGTITVNGGQTLTVANGAGTDLDVSGTIVNAGTITPTGTIAFESSGKYQHNQNGGVIPAATWDANSTCEIIGWTTSTGFSSFSQSFGNFTWNNSGGSSTLNFGGALQTITGNFRVQNTGSGAIRLFSTAGGILNVSGNVTIDSTGTLSLNNGTAGVLDIGGNLSVAGVLTTGGTAGSIVFNGTGTQTFSSTGTLPASSIDWFVNNGSTLALNTGLTIGNSRTLTVNSTAMVNGSGAVTIANGATLNGTGTISVGTTINSKGTVTTGSSVGTLSFTVAPTLSGTNLMKIDRNGGSPLSDKIILSSGTLIYGGILTINNLSVTPFVNGDTFTLFNAPSYGGAFTGLTLLQNWADPTLRINTNNLTINGSISIGANNAPMASSLMLGTAKNTKATFPLAKYASDTDGDSLTVSFNTFSSGGSASYVNGTVTYTPLSTFTGSETFNYVVADAWGASATATVTATVTAATGSGANILSVSYDGGTSTATVVFAGIPGATYQLQISTDLNTWTPVGSNVTLPVSGQPSAGKATVQQTSAPMSAFYRTMYVSGP